MYFPYFYHVCFYSFMCSYHVPSIRLCMTIIFISYTLIFTSCHLLVTSYILLTYIFMYFIRLSYLMTYTYTFLYLYVFLILYQTVLSSAGVQNRDSSFDTYRYFSYLYSFTYQIYIYCYFLCISTSFLTMYSN